MSEPTLFYAETEEELAQWALTHSANTKPYSLLVFEHYGNDSEMHFEFICWLKHMKRTFPESVQRHGLDEYIAGVYVVALTEIRPQ